MSDSLYKTLEDDEQHCKGIKWFCKVCLEAVNQFTVKTKMDRLSTPAIAAIHCFF